VIKFIETVEYSTQNWWVFNHFSFFF